MVTKYIEIVDGIFNVPVENSGVVFVDIIFEILIGCTQIEYRIVTLITPISQFCTNR
jgi:hypothetical protein